MNSEDMNDMFGLLQDKIVQYCSDNSSIYEGEMENSSGEEHKEMQIPSNNIPLY